MNRLLILLILFPPLVLAWGPECESGVPTWTEPKPEISVVVEGNKRQGMSDIQITLPIEAEGKRLDRLLLLSQITSKDGEAHFTESALYFWQEGVFAFSGVSFQSQAPLSLRVTGKYGKGLCAHIVSKAVNI